MTHSFITVVIPLQGSASEVEREIARLAQPGNLAKREIAVALDQTQIVHFMSMHALPASADGGAALLLELSVDGPVRRALELTVRALEPHWGQLLKAARVTVPAERLAEHLARHHQPVGQGWFSTSGLSFSGTPGMTVQRIKQEAALAGWVAEYLGAGPHYRTALQALQHVRERVWAEQWLKDAFTEQAWPFRDPQGSVLRRATAAFGDAIAALLWPFLPLPLLAFLLAWVRFDFANGVWVGALIAALELALLWLAYRGLRRMEQRDRPDDQVPSAQTLLQIAELEDRCAQNHLRVLSPLKPGRLRRIALRVAFFLIGQAARRRFAAGYLSDIHSIHFARWIVLPGSSRLLFLSNYGGSWESYLEDFISKAHAGLTGIWSNTQGFPRTRHLFLDGATDGARFKAWARRQQHPTPFWYSAYPGLTTGRIRVNAAIHRGIAAARTEDEAAEWLRLLGAAPPSAIEVDDVPTLVFGGLPKLRFGTALLLRLPDPVARAKAWLTRIAELASFGEQAGPAKTALLVAFAQSGLRKLGLTEQEIASFPVAFQHGSVARARLLGDTGDDHPAHWRWGGPARPTDAIVLLYAANKADLARLEALASGADPELLEPAHCWRVEFTELPTDRAQLKEPFGFVDGISQPVIKGSSKAAREVHRDELLEPGEIVLGYPDNLGFFPPTPVIAADADPDAILTDGGMHRVEPAEVGRRNLGFNGTFLVVRQLEQHVDRFREFVDRAAADATRAKVVPAGVNAGEWISAKMVGRWSNGASLVRYPAGAPAKTQPDNDFLFGAEDPDGLRCPFGAHIRRANPRDSFAPGSARQMAITNRHRILRAGRPYQSQEGAESTRGLLFMCLNADIERQFEFVQQSWMRAPSFHRLANEIDPVAVSRNDPRGGHPQTATALTIPTANGPLVLRGMTDFVTLRGSGYFFLPGRRALQFLARSRSASSSVPAAAE